MIRDRAANRSAIERRIERAIERADDLKLGHTVALKFLPRGLSEDTRRLELFHSEVRLTRQISHPNVCRVYDIGEADGQHFPSMQRLIAALMKLRGKGDPEAM